MQQEPPDGGVQQEPQWRRPSRRYLRVQQVGTTTTVGVLSLVVLVPLGLVVGSAAVLGAGAALLVLLGVSLLLSQRRWAAWGYLERADELLVRRGLLFRRLSAVPYGRMQFVDVTAGPLSRALGLADVHLHTAAAATDAVVPGLPQAEADRLRDRLAALGQARAAGL